MQALRKLSEGNGNVELVKVPKPEPTCGQVLIKVERAGICGTDLHIQHGQFSKARPPVTLGHEFSGIVTELGPGVESWSPGERVTVESEAHRCGLCQDCIDGFTNLCHERRAYGYSMDGGFASYVAVRATALHRISEQVTFQEGALCEPLAVAVHAVMECGSIKPGETALVTGPGPIGLMVVQVARAAGARVIITGIQKDRLRLDEAVHMGAAHAVMVDCENMQEVVMDFTDGVGMDAAFECSGIAPALNDCLNSVKKRGRIIQVGLFGCAVKANMDQLTLKEIDIKGSFAHNHATWKQAIDLLDRKKIDLKAMVSGEFTLDEWQEAFRLSEEGAGVKYLLCP